MSKRIKPEWTVLPQGENMSIHDFHSKLISGGERNVLFVALRKLSRLNLTFFAETTSESGWPIWDESGSPPSLAAGV